MYQDVKVAVISGNTLLSNALCTLLMLERVSCTALGLEEGLTYATHRSNGCIVLHVQAGGIPYSHIVRWRALGVGVVLLSEAMSEHEVQEVFKLGTAAILKAPVNSRDLLDAVYSVLLRAGDGKG